MIWEEMLDVVPESKEISFRINIFFAFDIQEIVCFPSDIFTFYYEHELVPIATKPP